MKMNVNASWCLTYGEGAISGSSNYKNDNDTEPHTEVNLNKSLILDYFLLKVKCLRVTVMTLVPISCFPRRCGFKELDSTSLRCSYVPLLHSSCFYW